ncbi:hypothetical protein WMY93_005287 [Mugilogobius chulae]|uniref:Peptidase S1 domain-containing protein n=1 Tax=Mugilogobius chulae TaxID=88201 RepID=A0AAW0Q1M3_9GOBI
MLGVHSIKNAKKDSAQIRRVELFIKHPCYDEQEKVNDLMLIKMDKQVRNSKSVKVLSLPKSVDYPAAGSTCTVAGWGMTKNKANGGSDVLMSVNVTVIDRVKCNSEQYYNFNPTITKGHICAGSSGKNVADSCQGDSGGPLLCKGNIVGVTSFGRGAKIINGKEVAPHSMPYMALLQTQNVLAYCGGTLISPEWVLTAAHCYKENNKIKQVTLGVHNIQKEATEKNLRQIRKVEKFIKYPNYNAQKKINDFMLIKLAQSVINSKTVQVMHLYKSIDPPAGSTCVIAGWGKMHYGDKTFSNVLLSVNVTVIDRTKCNSESYYNNRPTITREHICAGSADENAADSCQGDSGGPLLCQGNLVGITSFGKGCGLPDKPGVVSFSVRRRRRRRREGREGDRCEFRCEKTGLYVTQTHPDR